MLVLISRAYHHRYGRADFYSSFKQLLGSLDSDREHLQYHTRLLTQGIEWEEQKRQESLLLRGEALESAENWLTKGMGKDLAKDPLEATLAGMKAVQTVQANSMMPASVRWSAIAALQQALYRGQERNRLEGHDRNISGVSVSPDGKQIVSSGWDSKLNLWQADGKLLWTRTEDEAINHVKFSPDGQQILSAGPYSLTLWDLEGRELGNWSFPDAITAIDWRRDFPSIKS